MRKDGKRVAQDPKSIVAVDTEGEGVAAVNDEGGEKNYRVHPRPSYPHSRVLKMVGNEACLALQLSKEGIQLITLRGKSRWKDH